jgi:hypothetical protein
MDIQKQESIEISMPVYNKNRKVLGDAFKLISYSVNAWEKALKGIEHHL